MEKLKAVPNIIWIGLGILLLLALFWFWGDIQGWRENRTRNKIDEKVEQLQKQVDELTVQRNKLIEEAKVAEAKAQVQEQENDSLRAAIDALNTKAKLDQEQKKIDDAFKNYENDKNIISVDIPAFERCNRLCSNRTALGYPCPANYCDKYR